MADSVDLDHGARTSGWDETSRTSACSSENGTLSNSETGGSRTTSNPSKRPSCVDGWTRLARVGCPHACRAKTSRPTGWGQRGSSTRALRPPRCSRLQGRMVKETRSTLEKLGRLRSSGIRGGSVSQTFQVWASRETEEDPIWRVNGPSRWGVGEESEGARSGPRGRRTW